jgi:hypothetical protein
VTAVPAPIPDSRRTAPPVAQPARPVGAAKAYDLLYVVAAALILLGALAIQRVKAVE